MNNQKVILVTGVSKGLGLAICKNLLLSDWKVYGVSRSITAEIEKLKSSYKTSFVYIQYDLLEINDLKQDLFVKYFKNVSFDGFVNNAALAYDDIVTNLDLSALSKMYTVNVFAPFLLTKLVLRNFILNKKSGAVVHISSVSVHTGYKGLSMYASTKGALEAFSKNVAREWGPKNIRSNCIVAGFMETNMSSSLSLSQKTRIYNRTALKLPTSKDSVANSVKFLLSDSSSSITGQNIFVDSGTI